MDKSPDAFRTISEVAEHLDVPQHVLRFWETRFSQIRPLKRGGGRRYYRPDDVDLLRGIRHLLYGEGYTIKGVQRILKEEGLRFVQSVGRGDERAPSRAQAGDEHAAEDDNGEDDSGEDDSGEDAAAEDESAEDDDEAADTKPVGGARAGAGSSAASPLDADGARGARDLAAMAKGDIERPKAALADLAECERVLSALNTPTEPGAQDEA
jgi:DNA-binding transcriptional MerR regulator